MNRRENEEISTCKDSHIRHKEIHRQSYKNTPKKNTKVIEDGWMDAHSSMSLALFSSLCRYFFISLFQLQLNSRRVLQNQWEKIDVQVEHLLCNLSFCSNWELFSLVLRFCQLQLLTPWILRFFFSIIFFVSFIFFVPLFHSPRCRVFTQDHHPIDFAQVISHKPFTDCSGSPSKKKRDFRFRIVAVT